MSKSFTVAALKQGDKFEFLTQSGPETKSAVMIVTRDPKVNLAAHSCFFRYQPDVTAELGGLRKWEENHSWNGPPDTPVKLLEAAPRAEPVAKPEPPKVEAVKVEAAKVEAAKVVVAKTKVAAVDEPPAEEQKPAAVKKASVKKAPVKKAPAKKLPPRTSVAEKSIVKKAARRRRAL
jgi:hypothetical protein